MNIKEVADLRRFPAPVPCAGSLRRRSGSMTGRIGAKAAQAAVALSREHPPHQLTFDFAFSIDSGMSLEHTVNTVMLALFRQRRRGPSDDFTRFRFRVRQMAGAASSSQRAAGRLPRVGRILRRVRNAAGTWWKWLHRGKPDPRPSRRLPCDCNPGIRSCQPVLGDLVAVILKTARLGRTGDRPICR
jgi:hypothetical protein